MKLKAIETKNYTVLSPAAAAIVGSPDIRVAVLESGKEVTITGGLNLTEQDATRYINGGSKVVLVKYEDHSAYELVIPEDMVEKAKYADVTRTAKAWDAARQWKKDCELRVEGANRQLRDAIQQEREAFDAFTEERNKIATLEGLAP